jgi:signal transduction histidine kinase
MSQSRLSSLLPSPAPSASPQPTVLQALHAENVKLQKFLAAQQTVITTLEQRAGRSLVSMGIYARQLAAVPMDSDSWQANLVGVQQEIHRLSDLLEDTLLLQKLEAGKVEINVEAFDLQDLLLLITRHWTTAIADAAREKCPNQLMCTIAPNLPLVMADRHLTEAALTDLLARGLQYTEAPVQLDVSSSGDRVVLRVTAQRFAPVDDRSFATEIVLCCRQIQVQGGAISCEHHADGLQTVVIELPVPPLN